MNIPWEEIRKLIHELGPVGGTFVAFFWIAHAALFNLYNGRLKDRQREIDRIAAENKEYRDRFTRFLDKELNIPRNLLPPSGSPPKRRKRGER